MQASSNHISVSNQSATPTLSPFHEEILTILFQSGCHINALLLDGKLTPSQLLAFVNDPAVKQVLEAWESLQELHQRMLARQAQITAAAHLDGALSDAHATPEARRAATTLTKLTTHMISPKRRPSEPPAQAGGEASRIPPQTPTLHTRHPSPTHSDFTRPPQGRKRSPHAINPESSPQPLANSA